MSRSSIGCLAWTAHKVGTIAVDEHTTPQLRHGLRSKPVDHLQLCATECLADVGSGGKSRIELPHERQTELIFGSPQVRNDRSRPTVHDTPHKTGYPPPR